jgi:hypothetical protein
MWTDKAAVAGSEENDLHSPHEYLLENPHAAEHCSLFRPEL